LEERLKGMTDRKDKDRAERKEEINKLNQRMQKT
jgi:hypothetical protein